MIDEVKARAIVAVAQRELATRSLLDYAQRVFPRWQTTCDGSCARNRPYLELSHPSSVRNA